jgi:tetratricopeptide (TPR) repeat protein
MSRFNSLEFEGQNQPPPKARPVEKDEQYYLANGQALFENGLFEQALRSFAKVLEFNPQNATAWTAQVRMLIELGDFSEAKLWADKALEKFPREAELLAAKAVALARLGDYQAALAFSDASIEVRGETPYVWLARGDVLLSREESKADFCFQKARGLAPGDWLLHWLASRICSFYKKFSLALKWIQQALSLNGGQSCIWLQMGQCQLALGLTTAARHSFEQALQLDPQCDQSKTALDQLAGVGFFGRLRNRWHELLHGS